MKGPSNAGTDLEGRQEERIPAILHLESTKKETVHPKENRSPDHNSQLLPFDILHPGNLDGEGDRRERQNGICRKSCA